MKFLLFHFILIFLTEKKLPRSEKRRHVECNTNFTGRPLEQGAISHDNEADTLRDAGVKFTTDTEMVPSLYSWYCECFLKFPDRLLSPYTVPLLLQMLHGNVSEI